MFNAQIVYKNLGTVHAVPPKLKFSRKMCFYFVIYRNLWKAFKCIKSLWPL